MILRTHKKSSYAVISNEPLNDSGLSWEARGLLAYLLSKPDGWQVSIHDLLKQKNDAGRYGSGRDKVYRMLNELKTKGYLYRVRINGAGGKFEVVNTIYESPSLNPHHSVEESTVNGLSVHGLSVSGSTVSGSTVSGSTVHKESTDLLSTDLLSTDLSNSPSHEKSQEKEDSLRQPAHFSGFNALWNPKDSKHSSASIDAIQTVLRTQIKGLSIGESLTHNACSLLDHAVSSDELLDVYAGILMALIKTAKSVKPDTLLRDYIMLILIQREYPKRHLAVDIPDLFGDAEDSWWTNFGVGSKKGVWPSQIVSGIRNAWSWDDKGRPVDTSVQKHEKKPSNINRLDKLVSKYQN